MYFFNIIGATELTVRKLNYKNFRKIYVGSNMFIFAIAVLYIYLLPPIYIGASDTLKAIIRLLVHTLIIEISFLAVRYMARELRQNDPRTSIMLVFPVSVMNALYGRFLLYSMNTQVGFPGLMCKLKTGTVCNNTDSHSIGFDGDWNKSYCQAEVDI